MNYLEQAIQYHNAGYRVIPVNKNKAPQCKWRQFIEGQTLEDIKRIFNNDSWGIALLMGNGLEALDIDLKYDLSGNLMLEFLNLLGHSGLGEKFKTESYLQTTINKGYHYIYKTNFKDGSKKLASRSATSEEAKTGEKVKVLFETRGEGGYVVIAPTDGYNVQMGSLDSLTTISDNMRNFVHDCARSFNEVQETKILKPQARNNNSNISTDSIKSWDDYNEKNDAYSMQSMLEASGWKTTHTTNDRIYLRRPGKDTGISGDIHIAKNLFKSFSTSTQFESDKAYAPFATYAVLSHGGDFSQASKAVYSDGYGSRQVNQPKVQKKPNKSDSKAKIDNIVRLKFDYDKPIEQVKTCFDYVDEYRNYPIGSFGTIGAIVGEQKTRKTTLIKSIVTSALKGSKELNFIFELQNKNIIYYDTEQPYSRFQMQNRDILNMSDIRGNDKRFHAYALRSLNRYERLDFIKYTIPKFDNIGLIVIDGAVDICMDYMDAKSSQDTLEFLMQLADETGAMILTVLHLTKAGLFPRGHLGTELNNKADWMIQTSKTDNYSTVKCRESRHREFPTFDFINNKTTGYPELMASVQENVF